MHPFQPPGTLKVFEEGLHACASSSRPPFISFRSPVTPLLLSYSLRALCNSQVKPMGIFLLSSTRVGLGPTLFIHISTASFATSVSDMTPLFLIGAQKVPGRYLFCGKDGYKKIILVFRLVSPKLLPLPHAAPADPLILS